MSHSKRGAQATAIGMICVLLGVISFEIDSGVAEQEANEKAATSWEKAERSPLIPYPETVTYTLAKMTASGNSGMPDGDTYEDNAYTRYLKKTLNVQNEDVLEVSGDENYYLYIQRMIAENNLPDNRHFADIPVCGQKGSGFDRADPSGQRHRHPIAVWPV